VSEARDLTGVHLIARDLSLPPDRAVHKVGRQTPKGPYVPRGPPGVDYHVYEIDTVYIRTCHVDFVPYSLYLRPT
jgi:hypothetical protein